MEGTSTRGFVYCGSLIELLTVTKAAKLSPLRQTDKWIIVDSSSTVFDTLKLFYDHSLTTLPVRNISTGTCFGFITVIDLLGYLLNCCSQPVPNSTETLNLIWNQFYKRSIQDVIATKQIQHSFVPFPYDCSLLTIVQALFNNGNLRLPQLPIINEQNQIVQILSQSNLISYIAKHHSVLDKEWTDLSLSQIFPEAKWGTVHAIPFFAKALDAFAYLFKENLTSVAIVDQAGTLVGNLSASDLKGLAHGNFYRLFLPVPDFLKETYAERNVVMTPPLAVKLNSTLEVIILKLAITKKHQVYVVDNSYKPVGVVTCADLMVLFATFINNKVMDTI